MTHSFPSVQENCNTRTGFTPAKMTWYFNQCFRPGDDRRDASPLFGELSADMPATLVLTTQFCPFRDEGRDYVRRLAEKACGPKRIITATWSIRISTLKNYATTKSATPIGAWPIFYKTEGNGLY